jgi:hypothetical protein
MYEAGRQKSVSAFSERKEDIFLPEIIFTSPQFYTMKRVPQPHEQDHSLPNFITFKELCYSGCMRCMFISATLPSDSFP